MCSILLWAYLAILAGEKGEECERLPASYCGWWRCSMPLSSSWLFWIEKYPLFLLVCDSSSSSASQTALLKLKSPSTASEAYCLAMWSNFWLISLKELLSSWR